MEISDVKAIIRSLLVSSATPYTVSQLLYDFIQETGVTMPLYKYRTPKAFLQSLTDTVKFVGKPPSERIVAIVNEKTKHISSLVQRQGRRNMIPSHPDFFLPKDIFHDSDNSRRENKMVQEQTESSEIFNPELKVKTEEILERVQPVTKYGNVLDSTLEGFLFEESDVKNVCPISGPGLRFKSSKKKQFDSSSDSGLQTSSQTTSSIGYVNDAVKEKIKKLMEKQTQGIWCSDFPDLYKDCYGYPLDYKEFGYKSLMDMMAELTEIIRYVRPGNGDWMLFDASKPPSQDELSIQSRSQCEIPVDVVNKLMELIESECRNNSKPGIYLDDLSVLYYLKFREKLNFTKLGFLNLKCLVKKLDGQILRLEQKGSRWLIRPVVEQNVTLEDSAVLTVTPEDDIFRELFPADVVKPGERFKTLEIGKCFRVGDKIDVIVANVCTPNKFFVQLKKYENDISDLTHNMNVFYSQYVNKYKMPHSTIQPGQICVGLHKLEDGTHEWERMVIRRLINDSEVLVNVVDYGNVAKIEKENLRFLQRNFLGLPVQSIAAKLSFIRPPKEDWPLKTCTKFVQLVRVHFVEFHVTGVDLETELISGVMFSVQNDKRVNVGKALVDEGMAVCVDEKKLNSFISSSKTVKPSLKNVSVVSGGIVDESKSKELAPVKKEIVTSPGKIMEPVSKNTNVVNERVVEKSKSREPVVKKEACSPTVESHAVNRNSALLDICRAAKNTPSLLMKKEMYALAFWLLCSNDDIKEIAKINVETGMQFALNIAENMLNVPGFSL